LGNRRIARIVTPHYLERCKSLLMREHRPTGHDRTIPSEAEVKRLAVAGEMRLAVMMYREIHQVGVKEALDAVRGLAGLPPIPEKIGEVALSAETVRRIRILFSVNDQAEASRLLVEKCGNNLPSLENSTARSLERFQFAALKLSEGNLAKLRDAIKLANEDWRDLLVAAEFANDVHAHETWLPRLAE
jgi:hypothetical protein